VILFGPYRARREAALAMDNPAEVSLPTFAARSATAQAYGGCAARFPRVTVHITVAHNKIPLTLEETRRTLAGSCTASEDVPGPMTLDDD